MTCHNVTSSVMQGCTTTQSIDARETACFHPSSMHKITLMATY